MTVVLAIANQKGGVGKTTTAVNLAASLAQMNRRVLLIDLDPQGNATMGSGIDKHDLETSVYDVLVGEATAIEAVVDAEAAGFDLIGANADLTGAELELTAMERREHRLRNALISIRVRYDFIILDCPPALGLLTVNGLVAADSVIIPMQCEYYALEGLSALLGTIDRLRDSFNPRLKIEGVIRTMYDPRNSLSREVSLQLIDHFGDTVYRTLVPRNVRLAEAPSYGVPIIFYDKYSRGAKAYLALAGEILNRHPEMVGVR
jgi:chromosome partitioning protein